MKVNTQIFKKACQDISLAVDKKGFSIYSGALSINADSDELIYLSTTDREIYMSLGIPAVGAANFKATIQTDKFFQLISKLTTEEIELEVDNLNLKIKANGEYKVPLLYTQEGTLLELPEITLNNITQTAILKSQALKNILLNNSREVLVDKVAAGQPQSYYYLDNNCAITYNTGVCYYKLLNESAFRILLSQKVVNLFKIFSQDDEDVELNISIECDENNTEIIKGNFIFKNAVKIAFYAPNSSIINKIPLDRINNMISLDYQATMKVNKQTLLGAIDRSMIFAESDFCYGILDFNQVLTLQSYDATSREIITPEELDNQITYSLAINLKRLRAAIVNSSDDLYISYGDSRTLKIKSGDVVDIIPRIII